MISKDSDLEAIPLGEAKNSQEWSNQEQPSPKLNPRRAKLDLLSLGYTTYTALILSALALVMADAPASQLDESSQHTSPTTLFLEGEYIDISLPGLPAKMTKRDYLTLAKNILQDKGPDGRMSFAERPGYILQELILENRMPTTSFCADREVDLLDMPFTGSYLYNQPVKKIAARQPIEVYDYRQIVDKTTGQSWVSSLTRPWSIAVGSAEGLLFPSPYLVKDRFVSPSWILMEENGQRLVEHCSISIVAEPWHWGK